MKAAQESPLAAALSASRSAAVALVGFSLGLNLLMLAPSIYMMQVYDRVLVTHSTDTLLLLSLMMTGALAAGGLLEFVRGRVMLEIGNWLERRVGPAALASSLKLALNNRAGSSPQALRDLSAMRGFLSGPTMFPLLDAPWAPLYLIVIFIIHSWLGWLAIGGAILLFGLGLVNELVTRSALGKASSSSMQAMTCAETALRNAEAVEGMGLADRVADRWRIRMEQSLAAQTRAGRRGGAIAAASRFIRLGLQSAVLGLGGYLAIHAQISPGGMIAASILMARAVYPVEQAIGTWRGVSNARQAYSRLQTILKAAPEGGPSTTLPRPKGLLTVESASFVPFGAAEPVLRNISFSLQPGEALGLIGPSASGKTSLARLLIGVWTPSAGHVRLDAAEISAWNASERGPYFGYLPQDVELLEGTVRENIARFTEASDEEVIAAAQAASVHDLILRLPNGYETLIGPGGSVLSGGQRQRIALARALFRDPTFLVLDEPNANLDAEGERALALAILAVKRRGATQVVIAHRPAVLEAMDKLLILSDGRVQDYGSRQEVLARLAGAAQTQKPKVVSVPPAQLAGRA